MSQNLRPTAPQPQPEPGYTLVDNAQLQLCMDLGGFATVGVFTAIVKAAQQQAPCTPALLAEAYPQDPETIARAVVLLAASHLLHWVDEDGGAA